MNYTTHRIDVTLKGYKGRSATSSAGSAARSGNGTGNKKKLSYGKAGQGRGRAISSSVKKAAPFAAAAIALNVAGRTVNKSGKVIGAVTDNRYREQRITDAGSMMSNPVGHLYQASKKYMVNQFEVQRTNNRIEYKRRLTGLSLPQGNGMTI